MNVLAVIPARGGSKGVKNKNIREVAGDPLISYTIKSAQESESLTRYVVSTDSPEISDLSQSYGCPVINRPLELAADETLISPVINHALHACQNKFNESYDILMLLQPTTPIRTGKDIDSVIEMFEDDPTEAVVSVVPMHDIHPARMYSLGQGNHLVSLDKTQEKHRRQDIEPVFYRNGAIYAIRTDHFLEKGSLIVENKTAYIMPADYLVNIDDERDLAIAQVLVRLWKNEKR